MIDILREIKDKLEQIEICVEELKDKILENEEELQDLKEELIITNNATWQETSE